MTVYEWFAAIEAVVVAVGTYHVFIMRRAWKSGAWVAQIDNNYAGLRADLARLQTDLKDYATEVTDRFDDAGERTSALATTVQGIEERLRQVFLRKDRFEDFLRDSREYRDVIRQQIHDLQQRPRR